MPITISLDQFERNSLFCEHCSKAFKKRCGLISIAFKQQPHLKCKLCKRMWPEDSIRSGKARGLLFLVD